MSRAFCGHPARFFAPPAAPAEQQWVQRTRKRAAPQGAGPVMSSGFSCVSGLPASCCNNNTCALAGARCQKLGQQLLDFRVALKRLHHRVAFADFLEALVHLPSALRVASRFSALSTASNHRTAPPPGPLFGCARARAGKRGKETESAHGVLWQLRTSDELTSTATNGAAADPSESRLVPPTQAGHNSASCAPTESSSRLAPTKYSSRT